jgi:uncharacterized protein with NAD-binding domain and iron-sulfur cluster
MVSSYAGDENGNRRRRRVAIVGGGLAGLTAAWELSQPGWANDFEAITVFERRSCLGGKGASTRGVHGRIEEHGLHVWLGYYHNAFRLMREVYAELDRPATDPACPIRTFDDAFLPAGGVGVGRFQDGEWSTWMAEFASNDRGPGEGEPRGRAMTVSEFVRHGVQLIATVVSSLMARPLPSRPVHQVVLSGSPLAPPPPRRGGTLDSLSGLGAVFWQAQVTSLVAGTQGLGMLGRLLPADRRAAIEPLVSQLESVRREVERQVRRSESGTRLLELVDLIAGCVQGILEDGLLTDASFDRIDHLDFREWLAPRVSSSTLDSPLVSGLYDLVFAYEGGDHSRPRFSAGLGLFLAGRLFLEYRGSVFHKMRAGMGDVVFVPLYQALVARGVRFEFGHRLEHLELDDAGTSVTALHFERERDPLDHDPLVRVRGLPCFPTTRPEPSSTSRTIEYRLTREDDVVVLAVSLGIIPHVAPSLVSAQPRWKTMTTEVATVATQSMQVWLAPSEAQLGWEHPGATVTAFGAPFDTYSSMSHLVGVEDWPVDHRPGAIGYFCSALSDDLAGDGKAASEAVQHHVAEFFEQSAGRFWPNAVDPTGRFRTELLVTDGDDTRPTPTGVYARANDDPSDRYVQSLPGTNRWRLRVDQSGVDNLLLAGDWTNCGLNAGCVEAAVMSGVEAANALRGRALTDGLLGRWYGLDDASTRV